MDIIERYWVNVDHLDDRDLEFFGWILFDRGPKWSQYWNPRYNEYVTIRNTPPRRLVVDDWNDAQAIARVHSVPVYRTVVSAPQAPVTPSPAISPTKKGN